MLKYLEDKKAFVENELKACVCKAYGEVVDLTYEYDNETRNECVVVTYSGNVTQRIDVNCDSKRAIITDVVTQLGIF